MTKQEFFELQNKVSACDKTLTQVRCYKLFLAILQYKFFLVFSTKP